MNLYDHVAKTNFRLCVALPKYALASNTFHGNSLMNFHVGESIVYLLDISAVVFPSATIIS